MEGAFRVIISLFILGLVVEQTKVEAAICCRVGTQQQACFDRCRASPLLCARMCSCPITVGPICPYTHPEIITLQKSDDSEQTKVEATPPPICCRTMEQRSCFSICRLPAVHCAVKCGCDFSGGCPRTQPEISTLHEFDGLINDYCKLGCASSVCNTITTTIHNSDVTEEEVKEAAEHCNNACSEICATKGSTLAQAVTA